MSGGECVASSGREGPGQRSPAGAIGTVLFAQGRRNGAPVDLDHWGPTGAMPSDYRRWGDGCAWHAPACGRAGTRGNCSPLSRECPGTECYSSSTVLKSAGSTISSTWQSRSEEHTSELQSHSF